MSDLARWSASMPDSYDRHLGPTLFAPYAAWVAQRAAELRPRRVLETAAGSGRVTAALVDALPDTEIVATDLNDAMVALGAQRVPGATWRQADAQALPFPDASTDLVVCQFGMMFLPDRRRGYAEMARVLDTGGHAIVPIWDSLDGSSLPAAFVAAMDSVLGPARPRFVEQVPHGYSDPAVIRADAEAGGLRVDDVEHVVLTGEAKSTADMVAGFCLGTPLSFPLAAFGPLDETAERIAGELIARVGDGPLETSLAAWVLHAGID